MGKWTRRDLVKAGLAASAGMVTGGDALAQVAAVEPHNPASFMQAAASAETAAGKLRERLSMDFGWHFALGHANDPDKDFGFGKLRREGTFAKSGRVDGPAAIHFDASGWRPVDLPTTGPWTSLS